MTFVILQAPNEGYYWLLKATCDRHFDCVDKGFIEIDSGPYELMRKKIDFFQYIYSGDDAIHLLTDRGSYIQTTDECLSRIMELNPNYLEDKHMMSDEEISQMFNI